jgi:phosphatidylinositol glycan class O
VAVLKNESGPGGLHEDTMLIVLGDHGQTLHGDHGGGTSEEVCFVLMRDCSLKS